MSTTLGEINTKLVEKVNLTNLSLKKKQMQKK